MFRNNYFIFILLSVLIKFVYCGCDSDELEINRNYSVNIHYAGKHKLYDCVLRQNGHLIACKVDIPAWCDDMVAFKVSRDKSDKCYSDFCDNAIDTRTYIHKNNKDVSTIDLDDGNLKSYKFYHRFMGRNGDCYVRYDVKDYVYNDGSFKCITSFASFIKDAAEKLSG